MSSIVIYYSITGNTRQIAEAIRDGMSRAGEPTDIARLREVGAGDLAGYDLIGLGSPVMRNRESRNVSNFIEYTMKGVEGKHGFTFSTHGATPGRYMARVVPSLTQRGLTVIGWNDWFCSCYFPMIPKPYFTDGHPDEIDLKEAADFGAEMVDRSRRLYAGETGLIPTLPRGSEYDDIYDPYPTPTEPLIPYVKIRDGVEFKINPEKCKYPKCTLCMDNCPMNCIDLSTTPQFYYVNCERCWVCEQICPNGAIEVDWTPLHEAHLPLVPPLEKALEIFEARGKFRRLVPLEDIGWDTPFWQKPHPRFKIV